MITNVGRGPLARLSRPQLPHNRRLPVVYRLLAGEGTEVVAQGDLARDARLALVEAALLPPMSP
jgi:hypothetical protein